MNILPFDRIISAPGWVQVDWTMTNVCNYSCEYCPTMTHDGSHGWPTLESVDYTTKRLQEHYGNGKRLEYILLGGELVIWKQFPEAIEVIRKNSPDAHIKLITNGIMPVDYWKRTSSLITSIVFSYHPTQVKDLKKFVDSVNASSNRNKTILLLAWPDVWDKVVEARNYIAEHVEEFTSLELKIVDNRYETITSAKVNYTEDQLNYIKANRKISKGGTSVFKPSFAYMKEDKVSEVDGSMMINGGNHWKDWHCAIGVDKITLDANGSIRRGSGCMIGNDEDFGNWKTLDIKKLPTTGVICPYNSCWCMPDMMASKHSPTIDDKFIIV